MCGGGQGGSGPPTPGVQPPYPRPFFPPYPLIFFSGYPRPKFRFFCPHPHTSDPLPPPIFRRKPSYPVKYPSYIFIWLSFFFFWDLMASRQEKLHLMGHIRAMRPATENVPRVVIFSTINGYGSWKVFFIWIAQNIIVFLKLIMA